MPPPIAVTLFPYSTEWALKANNEAKRILSCLKDNGIAVHHIGSTSIGNICAKPIIDLMPEVECLELLDQDRAQIKSLGYEWWGEYGIANRRYCTLSDHNGHRLVQLHIFARGDRQIEKHLAFRDYLRAFPDVAREYEREKKRCQSLHPQDSHAYSDAKSEFIVRLLPQAIKFYRANSANQH